MGSKRYVLALSSILLQLKQRALIEVQSTAGMQSP